MDERKNQKGSDPFHSSCCPDEGHKSKRPWYRDGLFWAAALTLGLWGASFVFPFLHPFRRAFIEYLRLIAWPVILGFLIGGVIDYYIPKEYISKLLAARRKRTVLYAAGLGFLMSACSHGILALSMELHKKGASGPAVVSFLLASPWANLPITFLLIGFFGGKGILIIAAALFVSISTGLIFQALDRKGWIEKNRHTAAISEDFSVRRDMARRWKERRLARKGGQFETVKGIAKGIWDLVDMVLVWILIGMILASLASAFVPAHIFHHFLGPSVLGLVVTMAAATVLEVCSEGTAPLAFEIYRQTGALGNAFAFLMGGVVTDYTEIGLLWSNLGKKTALWTLAVTLPQVFVLGLIFNALF